MIRMKIVMKFGGSSVANGTMIRRAAEIVAKESTQNQITVVSSAMEGVTDSLLTMASEVSNRGADPIQKFVRDLYERHLLAIQLGTENSDLQRQAEKKLKKQLHDLEEVFTGIAILRELTPRSKDHILSFGEQLLVPIFEMVLQDLGLKAKSITGKEAGIVTDDIFGDASPLKEQTRESVRREVGKILRRETIPVITGFVAANQNGNYTTLGRGGSDYTATIIGDSLDFDEVWILTDVDGFMTSDPRLVPEARLLSTISYLEAIEMVAFGAKAMHPKALIPAAEKKIPIRIKNTFNPKSSGTLIAETEMVPSKRIVKALGLIRDVAMINVSGTEMVGRPGMAGRIFDILGKNGINILMISQSVSEANITFLVSRNLSARTVSVLEIAFLGKGLIREVRAEDNVSVISVLGAGMRGTPGIAAKVFGAVASHGINVRMVAQGSSELNISFAVQEQDCEEALRVIHKKFKLEMNNY
ncbi:aspartate kinase, monofunctional class [Candidatus Bathyarchaeota archaeon]|nr:aspartate kinase, monofunctional class [Candidatus Bathyarchaeota archaeon]